MSDPVLSLSAYKSVRSFYISIHSVPTKTLSSRYCSYSHLTDGETESQNLRILFKVAQQVNGELGLTAGSSSDMRQVAELTISALLLPIIEGTWNGNC